MTFPIWRDFMKCLCYIASVLREADCRYKSLLETGSAMWPPPVSPARQLHWRCLWLQSPWCCATGVGRWLGDSTVWLSSVWPGTASWGTPSSPPATRPTWRRGGDALSEGPRLSTKVCGVSLWLQQYCSMVGEATHLGRRDGVSDRVRRIQWDHSHSVPAAGSTQTSHRSLWGQPGHPQPRGPDLSSNNRPLPHRAGGGGQDQHVSLHWWPRAQEVQCDSRARRKPGEHQAREAQSGYRLYQVMSEADTVQTCGWRKQSLFCLMSVDTDYLSSRLASIPIKWEETGIFVEQHQPPRLPSLLSHQNIRLHSSTVNSCSSYLPSNTPCWLCSALLLNIITDNKIKKSSNQMKIYYLLHSIVVK